MIITKKISKDNELYLYMNGKLIFKRWIDDGYSKVFDLMAYNEYTLASITDLDLNNTEQILHVKANLTMHPTSEGGRKTGFKSGYRPNHVFDNRSNLETYIGDINFEHQELFLPGEKHEVIVRFFFHQPIEKYLNIGRKWWIYEGGKVIGEAEMLEIILPSNGKLIQE